MAEIPAEGSVAKLSALEIHENYRRDVERGKLVRKQQSATKAETEPTPVRRNEPADRA